MLIGLLALVLFFVAPMSANAMGDGEDDFVGGTWHHDTKGWWYELEVYPEGYLHDGIFKINGKNYYFDASGYMKNGWVYVEAEVELDMEPYGDWYYFDKNGAMVTGWLKSGADWYYMDPEYGYMWWDELVDGTYFVDYDGKMLTDDYIYGYLYDGPTGFGIDGRIIKNGWLLIAEYDIYGWAYFDANGQSVDEGWVQSGNNWYYMANGLARVGTYLMDYQGQKHLYEFATDGRLVLDKVATKGWIEANGKWYYYEVATDFQGLVRDSWKKINDAWYYFDSRGIMCTNELVYDAGMHCHYVVDANGCMAINQWVNVGNGNYPEWVYADANGIAYENKWLQIGNNWYYFEGHWMVEDRTSWINGELHAFAKGGAWLGKVESDAAGWKNIGGKWYYFENGEFAWGIRKIDGQVYGFDYYMLTNDFVVIYIEDYDYEGLRLGGYQYLIGFNANGAIAKNQWIYVEWLEEWIWFDENGYGVPPESYYGAGM